MAKRKRKTRGPEYQRFTLRVSAGAASVGRMGPKISKFEPEGDVSACVTIEGALDRPAMRDVTKTVVLVFEREARIGNPGAAIGGNTEWHVVADLPPPQFAHLLALVLADRLRTVSLLFEDLKRGNGILRSVSFNTAPVPSEAEDEDPVAGT